MFARIAHVAIYTENFQKMANFYKSVFGMKQITSGMTDDTGQLRTDLGHISDGVIGLALLKRNAGIRSGLDHFGFDVKDIKTVVDRIGADYPEILVKSDLGTSVPFVSTRTPVNRGVGYIWRHKIDIQRVSGVRIDGTQPKHERLRGIQVCRILSQ